MIWQRDFRPALAIAHVYAPETNSWRVLASAPGSVRADVVSLPKLKAELAAALAQRWRDEQTAGLVPDFELLPTGSPP